MKSTNKTHSYHRRATVHGHREPAHREHQEHPGIRNTAIGAGVFGALVVTLAGLAIIIG